MNEFELGAEFMRQAILEQIRDLTPEPASNRHVLKLIVVCCLACSIATAAVFTAILIVYFRDICY